MGSRTPNGLFRDDPIAYVEKRFRDRGGLFRLSDGTLCVAEPDPAMAVLRNENSVYGTESGFFDTGSGVLSPRSAQVAIGRGARALLRGHIAAGSVAEAPPAGSVADEPIRPVSDWPAAGAWMVYRSLAAVLADPLDRELSAAVLDVVRRNCLVRPSGWIARRRQGVARNRVLVILERATARRRATRRRGSPPRDLLDVVLDGAPPDTSDHAVATVHLMMLRTSVAPVGYAVGWALRLLAGSHPRGEIDGTSLDVPAEWIVREALRMWPVAWLFGRPVRLAHSVGGVPVAVGDSVAVCAYLLHRHPEHWVRPEAFLPRRWEFPVTGPYLPFGAGPFACAGGGTALALAADLLERLLAGHRLTVCNHGDRAHVEGIVVPPPFTLDRCPIVDRAKRR